ncbi:hypothetical protein FACS189483_05040 [Spirochaetia bacterium]|nr:hypothetical protein FACS189483_05040 [Spirochaetia bacterium]
MDCIFCQKPSDNSRGVEHIIPESLGNEDIILWRGAVCDLCNNYFSHIEGELLEQPYFISLRHRNFIKTKKNHLVAQKYLFPNKNIGWVDTKLDFEYGGPAISFEQNKENGYKSPVDRYTEIRVQDDDRQIFQISDDLAKKTRRQ